MKPSKASAVSANDSNELRLRILRVAFAAFAEKGYAGASTLLIATRAKVSKRDLYALFPSKEAMLLACITSRSERMRLPEGLPEPQTRAMLAATLEAFAANFLAETLDPDVIGMYRLAIAEAVRSPEVARLLEDARDANRAALHALFERAQSKGLLPPGDTAEMVQRYLALTSEDLILGSLLGGPSSPSHDQIQRRAASAPTGFLRLYPAQEYSAEPR